MAKARKKTSKKARSRTKVPADAKRQTKYLTTRPVTVAVTAYPITKDEAGKRFCEAMRDIGIWFFGYPDDPREDPIAVGISGTVCSRMKFELAEAITCEFTLVFGAKQNLDRQTIFDIVTQCLYDHKLYSPTMTEDNEGDPVTYRVLLREYKTDKHAYLEAGQSEVRGEPIVASGSAVTFNPSERELLKRKLMR